jgi:hypothetical protein
MRVHVVTSNKTERRLIANHPSLARDPLLLTNSDNTSPIPIMGVKVINKVLKANA